MSVLRIARRFVFRVITAAVVLASVPLFLLLLAAAYCLGDDDEFRGVL